MAQSVRATESVEGPGFKSPCCLLTTWPFCPRCALTHLIRSNCTDISLPGPQAGRTNFVVLTNLSFKQTSVFFNCRWQMLASLMTTAD